jgi:hypothetical protein
MFSQYGQDQFVVELLGGLRGGFFLDSANGQVYIAWASHLWLLRTAAGAWCKPRRGRRQVRGVLRVEHGTWATCSPVTVRSCSP